MTQKLEKRLMFARVFVFVLVAWVGVASAMAQIAPGGGGGGGSGGTVAQGSAASASGAWPVYETVGGVAMSAANGLFVNPATGATFPVSGSVSISGSVAVTGTFWQATQPVSGTVALGAGAANIGTIGNTSFGATQATAANLNATVVGTGTFATQAAQSGNWNVGVNNQPVGTASIASAQASPTTSATILVAARTGAAGTGRVAATLYNFGSVTVFVGPSGVTTSTGTPLLPSASLTLNTTAAIYGITSSGTGSVSALETY